MIFLALLLGALGALDPADSVWVTEAPLFSAGSRGSFDETAVKDPSIVFHGGLWHVFYTARGQGKYSLGYVAAPTLNGLQQAKRHPLPQLRGMNSAYAAAPQIFFFAPQQQWYLVFQTRDAKYQPVYATTKDIGDPGSWSVPKSLVEKQEGEKWIDFWVIRDEARVYLFYTRSHEKVYRQSTAVKDFPRGFGQAREVFGPVHEAVHIYKAQGKQAYHLFYEIAKDKGQRSHGLATATSLDGAWRKVREDYATGSQFTSDWTDEVSHGEMLRTGIDARMEYDSERPQFFFQGILSKNHHGDYAELGWRLGLLTRP